MEIYNNMQTLFGERAEHVKIKLLSLGLGYSAVVLSDGSVGMSYTYISEKDSCTLFNDPRDFEGKPASQLLDLLESNNLVERSAAIALVNALNHPRALEFKEDRGTLLDDFAVGKGDQIAMAGYFGPVVAEIEKRGATVYPYDIGKGIGEKEKFYRFLSSGEAKGFIFTSTSVINGSTEEVLEHLHIDTPCVMLGPTTPMVPEAFEHLPVNYLGGTVADKEEGVLKAIRHGRGTPSVMKSGHKVYYSRKDDPVPALQYNTAGRP